MAARLQTSCPPDAVVTAPGRARSIKRQAAADPAAAAEAGTVQELDVPAAVRRARRGDEDAAKALLAHLYPLVLSVVRGHLPRRLSEEDLTQMVFTKIFTKLDQFSGIVPLEHWVSRVAVNTCLNALQAEKIRPEFRWADLTEEEEHVVKQLASTQEELDPDRSLGARDLVEKLLETLKPNDRMLLRLLHMEGRSVQEIRQLTGWNISLIKVRAFRARQKLKKQLQRLMKQNTPCHEAR
jgi:RNA polymerase sigma-70 factor (ECF subfamily)